MSDMIGIGSYKDASVVVGGEVGLCAGTSDELSKVNDVFNRDGSVPKLDDSS